MALPQPRDLPRPELSRLNVFLYAAPITFLPLVILAGIFEGALAAKYTFLMSLFVPFALALVRSNKNHARKQLYARYFEQATFVQTITQAFNGYQYHEGYHHNLSPNAAAYIKHLNDNLLSIHHPDHVTLDSQTFAVWEGAFLQGFATCFPNENPDPATFKRLAEDAGTHPKAETATFLNDVQDRVPVFLSFHHFISQFITRFSGLPLSPNLQQMLADVRQDHSAVSSRFSQAQLVLFTPPENLEPYQFFNHYDEQLRSYLFTPLVPTGYRKEMRPYFLSELSYDLENYLYGLQSASHSPYVDVMNTLTDWLPVAQTFASQFEAALNTHLAATGVFTLGSTANIPQPDASTIAPMAITLTPSERRTHTYVIGRTGSGKTTLLKNLITQDLRNPQQGVIVLSPENKVFEDLLDLLPPERADALIYFDPTDTRPPIIGFNPFTFEDGDDLNQKAQETYTIFERALGDLGVKMTTMLQNAAYALIQRKNSRLLDLDTLLNPSNNTLRYKVAQDPSIDERTRNFWEAYNSSAYYKSAYEPVVNRLDPFFRPPHATILSTNSFSWDDVLNKKPHIIFCNLSRLKGMEAQIMGQLLIAQIQQTIFHRDPKPESSYIPYALYIDEFQTYATTGEQSFIETLNKARKYHFALTLAHQVTSDIPPKLLSSIVGNVGTVIALRTSAEDAPFFTKDLQIKDADGHSRPDLLQNLPIGQAIVRTPRHNIGIAIGVPAAPPPLERDTPAPSLPRLADTYAATLKTLSKRNFGQQPTLHTHEPDNVQQQPISAAAAPVEPNGSPALEPEPDDTTTIVVDETQTFLPTATRRRGRPPRSSTPAPQPAPRTRRQSTNGEEEAP